MWEALRRGNSLYCACVKAQMTTRDFYQELAKNSTAMEEFRLALADYADQCMDDIRAIVSSLKAGEVDNSTAKLLIETQKWLAQKANPEPTGGMFEQDKEKNGRIEEIIVTFV